MNDKLKEAVAKAKALTKEHPVKVILPARQPRSGVRQAPVVPENGIVIVDYIDLVK